MADESQYFSPFRNLMNPDNRGTAMGFLGALTGSPTTAERTGMVRSTAIQELQKLQNAGASPQQALMKFMSSPQGTNMFATDPSLMDTLKEWAASVTPPQPKQTTLSAGQQLYSTDPNTGKTSLVASNPTEKIQSFQGLSEIAGLSPERRKALAEMQLMPDEKRVPMQEAAIREMMAKGEVSPETGRKIMAGVYKETSIRNEQGEIIGSGIMDMTTGEMIKPTQKPAPGTNPSAVKTDPAPQVPGDQTILADPKKSMYLASGAAPYVATTASGIAGQVAGPVAETGTPELMSKRFNAIQQHRVAVASFADKAGGLGIPSKFLSEVQSLSDFGTASTMLKSPLQAVNNGIQLNDMLTNSIQNEELNEKNSSLPKTERVNAAKRRLSMQRILDTMPNKSELSRLRDLLIEGKSGAYTPNELLNDVEGMIGKAGRAGKKTVNEQMNGKTTQKVDINSMSVSDLVKVKPATLSAQDRALLKKRLDAILGQAGGQ